jgi:hypothetical protein
MAERFELEVELYVAETAQMRIPEGDHVASFLGFADSSLSLIQERWPAEALGWHRALSARREGALSMAQWREVHESIASYRASLGEPYGMNEAHGERASISFLFALAVESPVVVVHQYQGAQLARLLDEFSCEFIEHFGRSREVLQALKVAFHAAGA